MRHQVVNEIYEARYEAFGAAGQASKIKKVFNLEEMQKRYDKGELDPKVIDSGKHKNGNLGSHFFRLRKGLSRPVEFGRPCPLGINGVTELMGSDTMELMVELMAN